MLLLYITSKLYFFKYNNCFKNLIDDCKILKGDNYNKRYNIHVLLETRAY